MPYYNLIQNFETTGYVATKFWKETRWSRIRQKRIGHAFARNALVTAHAFARNGGHRAKVIKDVNCIIIKCKAYSSKRSHITDTSSSQYSLALPSQSISAKTLATTGLISSTT